jgi:glycosyltransferase involved in cell wall biosynthesis
MELLPLVALGLVVGAVLLARIPALPAAGAGPATPTASTAGPPRVSIVVPARNEEHTLPVLLTSLARLDPTPDEVIVVDDGSTDATAVVAAAHGARVIVSEPPAGRAGKPWACHVGAQAATGEVLVFLDADTWLAPDALGRLVDERARAGGLVSVEPHHVTRRPYEQLSAFFNVTAMMGTGAFAPGRRGRGPMAFGPCLVTSAVDHRAVGGHAAVAGEVVEDVHLARRYRAHGLPVRSLRGGDAVAFRMYAGGVRQLVEGWTKNIAAGAGLSPRWALAGSVAWVASCVAVALGGLRGLAGWAVGGDAPLVAALTWAVVAAELAWMLTRIGVWRWWTVALFPLSLAAFLAVFARSLAITLTRGEVTWRDRRLPVRARWER